MTNKEQSQYALISAEGASREIISLLERMMIQGKNIHELHLEYLKWYQSNRKNLPWINESITDKNRIAPIVYWLDNVKKPSIRELETLIKFYLSDDIDAVFFKDRIYLQLSELYYKRKHPIIYQLKKLMRK